MRTCWSGAVGVWITWSADASSSYDVIVKMAEEPQQKKPRVQSENYKDRFLAVFPELVDCVTKDGLKSSEIAVAMQHFKSVSTSASFITASD